MVNRDAAAGTVNHMLSGVRSTVRIAWELGLVDDKTRIAVEDEPNEKPQQRQRAGRYVKRGEVRRLFAAPGTDPIGARDVAMLALLYGAGLQALGSSRAPARGLYDQVSGAISVRHDERQVYAINGGKEAIDAWIASRGDWPGALLCPVAKGGRIQPSGHDRPGRDGAGAQHRRAGGRRSGYAERSTPDVLDRAGEAAPRRPDEGQAGRVTDTRDAVRSVPGPLIRRQWSRGGRQWPERWTSSPFTGGFRRRLFTAVLARVRWSKTETRKGRRRRYLKNGVADRAKGISSRL